MPVDALHPFYVDIASYLDLPKIMGEQIAHFFSHYKDLEKGKWTRIGQKPSSVSRSTPAERQRISRPFRNQPACASASGFRFWRPGV